MQTWKWDTVMVDQACAKSSMCCNVKVRNKRQKQKINSDVCNCKPMTQSQKFSAPANRMMMMNCFCGMVDI